MVTNGPYLLTSWKHENEIELQRQSALLPRQPAIDKVRMFMVNEKTTALAMYVQGQLRFC